GGQPYATKQPLARSSLPYLYPPACLWQFAWCGLPLGPRQAKATWLAVAGIIVALAVFAALRGRRDLGLWLPPWPFALALVLCSSPVLFALERANCNVLVLLHLLLGIVALRRRSLAGDAAAGLLLGLAFWTKIYPLLLIGGLLPLRRWRAFACAVAATGLMAVLDLQGLAGFLRNNT